jgi:hypothetical protein
VLLVAGVVDRLLVDFFEADVERFAGAFFGVATFFAAAAFFGVATFFAAGFADEERLALTEVERLALAERLAFGLADLEAVGFAALFFATDVERDLLVVAVAFFATGDLLFDLDAVAVLRVVERLRLGFSATGSAASSTFLAGCLPLVDLRGREGVLRVRGATKTGSPRPNDFSTMARTWRRPEQRTSSRSSCPH